MGITTGHRVHFLWNRRHGFGWFLRFFRWHYVCLFTRRGLMRFRGLRVERTSDTSRRGLGFGRDTILGHRVQTFIWTGVDDDIIEFSVRPYGTSCHVYFGCDYRCRVLLVETIDGWVPSINPEAFKPGAWDAPPRPVPQVEDFGEGEQILAEFDTWEDNASGGSGEEW